MKVSIIFKWYFWGIGAYWGREKKCLYIFFLPTLAICLNFKIQKKFDGHPVGFHNIAQCFDEEGNGIKGTPYEGWKIGGQ